MLSHTEIEIIQLSIKIAGYATLFNLPIALIFAWLLARYEFRGKVIIDACLQLPLVLPPVVLGYALLVCFGPQGLIGQYLEAWGMAIDFRWQGAVLASMLVAFPLMLQPIRLAFTLLQQDLTEVAQTLGANIWQIFYKIHLPLALPGICMGSVLAFSRSLGEFGATISFVGNIPSETRTIPIAIYSLLQQPDAENQALRLVIISIFLAFIAVLAHHKITSLYLNK